MSSGLPVTLLAVDHALVANPGQSIAQGGYIFSLLVGDRVVGVCVLFNQGKGVLELAAVEYSRVYWVSNTKLEAATAWYKKSWLCHLVTRASSCVFTG